MIQSKARWLLRSPGAIPHIWSQGVQTSSSSSSAPGSLPRPRTVHDLPRVSFLELLCRMFFQGFYNRLHELQIYEKQRYGPIYRDGLKAVSLNTPQLLEEVMRNDETFPCRGDMSIWKEYRDMKGLGYGPFTVEGEEWHKLRVMLNRRMLRPKDTARYAGTVNDVVTDFIKRIYHVRQCSSSGDLVPDLANELYRFSLEGIAAILFETRIGCLEKEIPAGTQRLSSSIDRMFSNSLAVLLMPKWSRKLLPHWERYIDGWDGIFSFAKDLIDKKLALIQHRIANSQDVEGEYLTYLLAEMSIKDVYGSVTELLLAGVDTTSNSLTWTFHLLSKNPDVQERLHKEVTTSVPSDRIPSAEELMSLHYLRAVTKEVLRMYPVVPWNARIISEKNVVIGEYQFSKNTAFTLCHYAISHDEETFPEPFAFKPERWLRDGRQRPSPFGSIPFGFGVRSCVGRRIAELEMSLVLFRLIRLFEVKPEPTAGEVKCLNRTVLVPDRPVNLHFIDRGCKNSDSFLQTS